VAQHARLDGDLLSTENRVDVRVLLEVRRLARDPARRHLVVGVQET